MVPCLCWRPPWKEVSFCKKVGVHVVGVVENIYQRFVSTVSGSQVHEAAAYRTWLLCKRDSDKRHNDIWCFWHHCTYVFKKILVFYRVYLVLFEFFQVWSRLQSWRWVHEEKMSYLKDFPRNSMAELTIVLLKQQSERLFSTLRKNPSYFGNFP